MKKNYSFIVVLLSPIVFGLFFAGVLYHGGSPGGKSGSPGDGADCTMCHAGSANSAENWITSDIPSTGYVLGETYTIIASGNHSGVGSFGFELTAEDDMNAKVGQFIVSGDNQTQLTNGNHSITHTTQGITPDGDEKIWTFQWVAPSVDVGVVTFYGAFNAANNNNSSTGDVIYLSNMSVDESTIGINEEQEELTFTMYPNPASDYIQLTSHFVNAIEIHIIDFKGNVVFESSSLQSKKIIEISDLAKGLYIVEITDGKQKMSKKLVIK
jgi:hypothetical protein